ncbi:hypothetical protein ACFRKD_26735 [Streptomyces niveus]|uniref:hypothetical protein n=1 Tax=Streptomyces niveus TaxID=193462 RepID=UPI0036AD90C0
MTANSLPIPVASAMENGAPRNLGALAATATGRGWGAMVERDGDAWTLIISTPADSRTARYTWVGGKWGKNEAGYRETLAFFRSAHGAPGANTVAPVKVSADDAEISVSDSDRTADASADVRRAEDSALDASGKVIGSLGLLRTMKANAVEAQEVAERWQSEAEDASNQRAAEDCAERAESAAEDCAEVWDADKGKDLPGEHVRLARKEWDRIRRARKAIERAQLVARDSALIERVRTDAFDAEGTAEELFGEIEEACESAASAAESARETADHTCRMCDLFVCGCRELMCFTLARHGSGSSATTDPEAVRIGKLLESDDDDCQHAGQLMVAGAWGEAEDIISEAERTPVVPDVSQGERAAYRVSAAEAVADVPATVTLPGLGVVPVGYRSNDVREGVSVPVVTSKGDDVQVWFGGYVETCWGHCIAECGGECDGCTTLRPVMLCDGMGQPYTWQDCAECMARQLGVSGGIVARAFTAVAGMTNHAAAAYAVVRHEAQVADKVAMALECRAERAEWGETVREWEANADRAEFGRVRDAVELADDAAQLRGAADIALDHAESWNVAAGLAQTCDAEGLCVPVAPVAPVDATSVGADAPSAPVVAKVDAPSAPRVRPSADEGWENGRTRERAAVLDGWVTVADAEDCAARVPQCVEVRDSFARYEGEWRRSPLLSTVHAAGVEFAARLDTGRAGGGWDVSLPTGDVSGAWGDIVRAVRAYVIAERPAHVVAVAECHERSARILAQREADYAAAEADGLRSLESVRADAVRVGAAIAAIRTVADHLSDEMREAVEDAVSDAGKAFGDSLTRARRRRRR